MTDYNAILDSQVEPDAPLTTALATQWRDNPLAMFEGAVGAPRIQNNAIDTGVIGAEKFQEGSDETTWLLGRQAISSTGALGTYAILRTSVDVTEGNTLPGVSLNYSDGTGTLSGSSPSGTWRAMGRALVGDATLFLRAV